MKSKVSYYIINLLNLSKRFLILFLIVYITSSPVVNIIFHQFDLKYESCEHFGEEDQNEKEMIVVDFEDKDQDLYSSQNLVSIFSHKFFSEFNPDIQPPPPKKV